MALTVPHLLAVEQMAFYGEYLHLRLEGRQMVIAVRMRHLENYQMVHIDGSQLFTCFLVRLFLDSLFPRIG